MNYRHLYHAGNFADVFKHSLLTSILTYQLQKPTPLHYIDTHAGIGLYDLNAPEAERAQEWRTGIGAVLQSPPPPFLKDYLQLIGVSDAGAKPMTYPGSPMIAARLLRQKDYLSLSEKHPEDFLHLQAAFTGDHRVRMQCTDGYQALNAWTPPKERRGLVLIDPPFEQANEFEIMVKAFLAAYKKWPQGIYVLWYPMKDANPSALAAKFLIDHQVRRLLQVEIRDVAGTGGIWRRPGLQACGLFIINPPYLFENRAREILNFLCPIFSPHAYWRVEWLVTE